ncbi:hypothetical protein [Cylindrospermopsis raciborskii]|uniref:Uncharacterized protein n=1 Tax=Cylindrospermopsis raciborskii CENA302 TaxID=1170768 RepID=A0A9Q5W964_9CYAN|nr:hypothetical protein [Cylindrospermopsis raciborskii]NLQ06353.1 hypothetical protein [Cylindrospermopsis raciborskii MVCC19]OHY35424.1 hypothetical protein BCV64_03385 [Cylindrospermopsis raciborskii MVCC14]OPH09493.1 hypothetical protein CENA302_11180 [Cylindrospermopsis raciborskii CENA302]
MRLIKKSEKLLLEKLKNTEVQEESSEPDITDNLADNLADLLPKAGLIETNSSYINYIPLRDNPIVYSVGNTGWQVSEIWKEIRLDDFYHS